MKTATQPEAYTLRKPGGSTRRPTGETPTVMQHVEKGPTRPFSAYGVISASEAVGDVLAQLPDRR